MVWSDRPRAHCSQPRSWPAEVPFGVLLCSKGCCRYAEAVCCENKQTCCPRGSTCRDVGTYGTTCVGAPANQSIGLSVCKSGAAQPFSTQLPNVLIVGDSVSIGYTPHVARHMARPTLVRELGRLRHRAPSGTAERLATVGCRHGATTARPEPHERATACSSLTRRHLPLAALSLTHKCSHPCGERLRLASAGPTARMRMRMLMRMCLWVVVHADAPALREGRKGS